MTNIVACPRSHPREHLRQLAESDLVVPAVVEDPGDLNEWQDKITPKTRFLWVETPSNPTFFVMDIAGLDWLPAALEAMEVLAGMGPRVVPRLVSEMRRVSNNWLSVVRLDGDRCPVTPTQLIAALGVGTHLAEHAVVVEIPTETKRVDGVRAGAIQCDNSAFVDHVVAAGIGCGGDIANVDRGLADAHSRIVVGNS